MSDLRKHLDAAKQEYQSLRYPGNLADELLQRKRSRVDVLIRLGAVAAMAAAMVVVIRLKMTEQFWATVAVSTIDRNNMQGGGVQYGDIDETASSETEDQSEIQVASFGELPAMSLPDGVGDGLDLAPAAPDFSFSAPLYDTGQQRTEY